MQSLRQFGPERAGVVMPTAKAASAQTLVSKAVQKPKSFPGISERTAGADGFDETSTSAGRSAISVRNISIQPLTSRVDSNRSRPQRLAVRYHLTLPAVNAS